MRRLHSFELIDQPWWPAPLRRAATDYLAFIVTKAGVFTALAPRLAALVDGAPAPRIVDLCAGGGGPYPALLDAVDAARSGRATEVVLTDLHPHERMQSRDARVHVESRSVDARAVPGDLGGVRTIFDGLHHFAPAEARAVLADAARARTPILVAEASERAAAAIVGAIFIPLFVLLVMPLVRPRSWLALLLTYLVPILPLAIFWDGLISCLRTYRVDELRALVADLGDGYRWEAGSVRKAGRNITFLVGSPTP
jgi:hypothetical protein